MPFFFVIFMLIEVEFGSNVCDFWDSASYSTERSGPLVADSRKEPLCFLRVIFGGNLG